MQMQPLRIFFIFSLVCTFTLTAPAQQQIKNYEKEWKKVDELISKKKLPQSALAEVKKIYTLAKKENQEAQIIKALVYMTGLQEETRENNDILSIKEIEKEIAAAGPISASILQSLLAEMYSMYFQNVRWQLYNRTETRNFKKEDIATWSAGDFHKKISALFLQSIDAEKILKQAKPEPYDAVILKGNVRHLRPTLYDLLAVRALDYFKNDERDIDKPAYAFTISSAFAFDPAADFVKRKFETKDSASLHHKALLIYQDLIAFHLNDKNPEALIDIDISRIEFVNEYSTHPDKKELYRNALTRLTQQYKNLPAAAQAWYLLAKEYNDDGHTYQPFGDTTHRFAKQKAKEICEIVLQSKDSSEGRVNCSNLLKEITKKDIQFAIEKVNSSGKPFRALISYQNVASAYFRIVKPDEKIKDALLNYYDEDAWKTLLNAPAFKTWEQPLPDTKDYQQHSAEVPVEGLPNGEYLLIVSSEKNFNDENAVLSAKMFYISNISYIHQGNDFFVLHRETGQPLANASVQLWQQVYDYNKNKYTIQKGKHYTADKNGFFRVEAEKETNNNRQRENYRPEISHQDDKLFMDDWIYDQYWYRNDTENAIADPVENRSVFFFLDRSIYRPGQTVYFKGITIIPDKEKKNKSLSGFKTFVYLFDANGQKADSLELTTNEYGSYSGKFQLPATGLNGNFSISEKDNRGQTFFSVEEYKRPKFYVEYEKLKGTYQLNDKIKITGVAKAYAGNTIDDAMVKYRVVRQPRYLYPWIFRRWWQPPSPAMEIAQGETRTSAEGKFEIEFETIPDKTIDKKWEPVFDYTVYADVTDINGETRSAETRIPVSYKALLFISDIPSSLPADSLKSLSIRTENMQGEFEPALVNVSVSKLKEEKRLIRKRYWQQPDQYVMSKDEFLKLFPYDEYASESDYTNQEKEQGVFEKSDSVSKNSEFEIRNTKFQPGFYVIEISTKDKNGEEVKDVRYIELFDEKSKQLNQPAYLWTRSSMPIQPGEKTSIGIGSSADHVFLVQQTDKSGGGYTFATLNNEKKSFEFSATENDRGGYGVTCFFIKHNRFYQFSDVIAVPWTNKELKIEYITFRDKTLPGNQEKWKVRISGYKNEKAAAEMLAGMYDASLDQFRPHVWLNPSIWPFYYSRQQWSGDDNFSKVESQKKWKRQSFSPGYYKSYDRLRTSIYQSNFENESDYARFLFKTQPERMIAARSNIDEVVVVGYGTSKRKNTTGSVSLISNPPGNSDLNGDGVNDQFNPDKAQQDNTPIQIRKNFNETAFFFPDLRTDSSGAIEFSFTAPEALTRWKLQMLAHTRELAFGLSSKEMVTQKQLMVQPNIPRFLREGDRMEIVSKVANLTEKEISGQAQLLLFDAATGQPVDGWFRNMFPVQYFTVAPGRSEAVKFPIEVPYLFNKAITWRIVAKAGEVSDGEEASLPVLTNRMLVTESMPINMKGFATKTFRFEKLLNAGQRESLKHHALTVEYTANPAWYAVQALPYLMEYPYECAEQNWNRYYANALAAMIANSSPKIKQVFEAWRTKDPSALLSNLQKNEELKSVLLEETPWVLEAKSEAEQKKNIALLFDLMKMREQLNSSLEKLMQLQSPGGGFVWFKGGPDNRYMTQYIVSGIGHLYKLNAVSKEQKEKLNGILKTAIPYLDNKIKEDYAQLKKNKVNLKTYSPHYTQVQYLYMRSFFTEVPVSAASQPAYNYFRKQAQQFWTKQNKYAQGMIALALHRTKDVKTPAAILKSLKETSVTHEELGMYWKDQGSGWFWYEAPIETQSLLIEAFSEIAKDKNTVDDLKTWLLKNKQTNNWKTTKATAEACYALLLQGSDWLNNDIIVQIKLGDLALTPFQEEAPETGSGYFKKRIEGDFVKAEMGSISVKKESSKPAVQQNSLSFGSVYWQYFEDLDKITTASASLSLVKKLFVEKNTDTGPVITPVNEGDYLNAGDKIKVRIELRVDRDMEYVHMKDMRASCLEPVNVLSGYRWQGGLGYYETTKDASTSFFFDYLRKGTYVFEYSLYVTHTGNFSNGVTTIQCMYAPEFSAHSEGIRINVE